MSIFKKRKEKRHSTPDEKLARKILGKDSGRKVWGFPCAPDIPARMKMLADKLNVPLYAVAEHALQLSAPLMAKMADDPEECALLRSHIQEDHVEQRTIEKVGRINEDMAKTLQVERTRHLQMDKVARNIVVNYLRKGMTPEQILMCIDYGLRYMAEAINHWPQPGHSRTKDP
jgi:hypothetical protein